MVDLGLAIGIALILGGIALLALELVHPGVLLFIPASILMVAGLLLVLFPGILFSAEGVGLILAGAVVAVCVEIPYYRWIARPVPAFTTTPSGLVGSEGVVVAPVIPNTLRGKVKIRSEVWSARATVDIPAGARVRVIHGEGVSVTVQPIDAHEAPPTGR